MGPSVYGNKTYCIKKQSWKPLSEEMWTTHREKGLNVFQLSVKKNIGT